jgi:hypothetical protein
MLHQPFSALPKGAPSLLTIKPWFDTDEARALLEQCVETPPTVRYTPERELVILADFYAYDPTDSRVIALSIVENTYLEAVEQISPHLSRAAGFGIGVTEAIDRAIKAAADAAAIEAQRGKLIAQGLSLQDVSRRMEGFDA